MYHKIKRAAFDIRYVGSVDQQYDDYLGKCMQLATTSSDLDCLIKEFLKHIELFLGNAVDLADCFRPALDSFHENYEFPAEPCVKGLKRSKTTSLFSASPARQESPGFLVSAGPVTAATNEQLDAATFTGQSWTQLATLGTVLTCSIKDSTLLLLQDFDTAVTSLTNRKQERDNIRLQYDYYLHKTQKMEKHNAAHPEKPLPAELVARNKAKLEDNYEMYYITNETLKARMEFVWGERLKHLGGVMQAFCLAQEMFFATMSDSLQIMEFDIPSLKDAQVQLKSVEIGQVLRRKERKVKGIWNRFKTGVQLFNVNKASMQSDPIFTHQVSALQEYSVFIASLQKQLTAVVSAVEQIMKTSTGVFKACLAYHSTVINNPSAATLTQAAGTLHIAWVGICDNFKQRMELISLGTLEEIKQLIAILRTEIKERDEMANVYEYWKAKVEADANRQNQDPAKTADRIAKRDQALAAFESFNQTIKTTELAPFLQCRSADVSAIMAGVLRVEMWLFQSIRDIFLTHATATQAANAAAGRPSEEALPNINPPPFSPSNRPPPPPPSARPSSPSAAIPPGAPPTERKAQGGQSALNTIQARAQSYRRETMAMGAKAVQTVAEQQAQRQTIGEDLPVQATQVSRKHTVAMDKIMFITGQAELNLMDCNHFKGLTADGKIAKYRDFFENLAKHPSIRAMDLTNTDVNDEFTVQLAKFLETNATIEEINLNSNPITDFGVQALCRALTINTTVKTLKLHNLRATINRETQTCLLNTLKTNKSLTKLMYVFPQRHDELLKEQYLDRNMNATLPLQQSEPPPEILCQHCMQPTNPLEEFCSTCHVSRVDPFEIFTILQRIGTGSFGAVYKAMDTRTSEIVAVKVLDVASQSLASEISILRQCDSDYIVRYIGDYHTPAAYWIVMEYCGVGSLRDIIDICQRTLHEDEIAVVMKSTLLALDYFHKKNKIHRDIKAGNILLTHTGDCKLSDFGVSAELTTASMRRNTVIGTPYWMAPEVIQSIDYDSSADIWALGITAIELAVGDPPHHELDPNKVIMIIPSVEPPSLPPNFQGSPEFLEFLEACLRKDGSKRPSAAELLHFAFIANAKGKGVIQELVQECVPAIEASREQPADEEQQHGNFQSGGGRGGAQEEGEQKMEANYATQQRSTR